MTDVLRTQWLAEEANAQMRGWDFSHIEGRCAEAALPWDYAAVIRGYLKPEHRLLDLDTGGGEFLLSLGHPAVRTAATEAWPPNIALCRTKLIPLGIDFRAASGKGPFPFADASFDCVTDRHGDLNAAEIARVLRPGGKFVTQQVGAENDRELVKLLMGETELPYPKQYLSIAEEQFRAVGLHILRAEEAFVPITF